MSRMRVTTLCLALIVAAVATTACRSEADRIRDEFSARLKTPLPLTPLEVSRLQEEANRAMEGKTMRLENGGVAHDPSDQERANVVVMLRGELSVEDAGVRNTNGTTLRGVMGPATPVNSELEAIGTVWVDVNTFLPRRYEFTSGQPDYGNYGYDISW